MSAGSRRQRTLCIAMAPPQNAVDKSATLQAGDHRGVNAGRSEVPANILAVMLLRIFFSNKIMMKGDKFRDAQFGDIKYELIQ